MSDNIDDNIKSVDNDDKKSNNNIIIIIIVIVVIVVIFIFIGLFVLGMGLLLRGKDGKNGKNGTNGAKGAPGTPGTGFLYTEINNATFNSVSADNIVNFTGGSLLSISSNFNSTIPIFISFPGSFSDYTVGDTMTIINFTTNLITISPDPNSNIPLGSINPYPSIQQSGSISLTIVPQNNTVEAFSLYTSASSGQTFLQS